MYDKDDTCKKKRWHKGDAMKDMGTEEYIDVLDQLRPLLGYSDGPTTRSKPTLLLHDRHPAHKAAATKAYLDSKGMVTFELPPSSPDLDPLDYGVFGTASRYMTRWQFADRLPWDECCDNVLAYFQELQSVEAVMKELPMRLEAMIKAKGGHIEHVLKQMKQIKRSTAQP